MEAPAVLRRSKLYKGGANCKQEKQAERKRSTQYKGGTKLFKGEANCTYKGGNKLFKGEANCIMEAPAVLRRSKLYKGGANCSKEKLTV